MHYSKYSRLRTSTGLWFDQTIDEWTKRWSENSAYNFFCLKQTKIITDHSLQRNFPIVSVEWDFLVWKRGLCFREFHTIHILPIFFKSLQFGATLFVNTNYCKCSVEILQLNYVKALFGLLTTKSRKNGKKESLCRRSSY